MNTRSILLTTLIAMHLVATNAICMGQPTSTASEEPGNTEADEKNDSEQDAVEAIPVRYFQPTPLVEPRNNSLSPVLNPAARSGLRLDAGANASASRNGSISFPTTDKVVGQEALPLSSSDVGSLIKKSKAALSTSVQAKTPVVSDPRIRGSRAGALAASGSHWVPARSDLDTILSKFDSRQIDSVTIIPGPYSALYGPGFGFTDVRLLESPRYTDRSQWHGSSGAEYKVNGNQFLGQQGVYGGGEDWGARFQYINRFGDDYYAGDRELIPSSYSSQEYLAAFGRDWKGNSLEVGLIYLDQQDLVFPGYVFDIDNLQTIGTSIRHTSDGYAGWDQITNQIWFNQTDFVGNAQNERKRQFFPVLDLINYVGFTDVESLSTGYSRKHYVGKMEDDGYEFLLGHDLRFIKQELNEISSGTTLGFPLPYVNRNSPIPRSYSVNPGLLFEYKNQITENSQVQYGGRVDYVGTDITEENQNVAPVGLGFFPASYQNIVGTDDYQRNFGLVSGFTSLTTQVTADITNTLRFGYAERAPNLTELYAAQPFMLLLQNGLNNVTGDPRLKKEKLFQIDWGTEYLTDRVKTGFRVFHAWGLDYITYENTQVTIVPPAGEVGQVSLRFVNTDLATFLGGEWFGELFPNGPASPFCTVRIVDGRDRTRNGNFATSNGNAFVASDKIDGLSRGSFSGVAASDSEPLPGISPLEMRAGMRFQGRSPTAAWNIETSARIVNGQDRVATSLLETPTGGFTVWDTRAVFQPQRWENLTIATGIENMFDKKYREHLDFRTNNGLSIFQPGANFYVSTTITY
ncbi:MAG: hypothetical protein ACK5PB_14425 [Pirellula sp.]